MSIRALLRDYPNRAIALVTPSHALIFRHSPSTTESVANGSLSSYQTIGPRASTDSSSASRCMVEFSKVSSVDLSEYRTLSPTRIYGTLGLININSDSFLCLVTGATEVASVRPGETVEKILAVEFYCLNSSDYDNISSDDVNPYGSDFNRQDNFTYGQNLSRRDPLVEHPCLELQKLLSNGSFYYSTDFDLTNRLQDRSVDSSSFDIDNLDESYLWNSYMIRLLIKFRSRLVDHEREALDSSRILTSAIRGFVFTMKIPLSTAPIRSAKTGLPSKLTLISRLSCRRAGTRFNSRGIDDDGNVANFVETETIYWSPSGTCFSYAQVRGSVPVFWEQAPGLIPGQQKISITRSAEGTQPAFNKHFEEIERNYGAVHIVNLLSETKPGEAELTQLYNYGVRHYSHNPSSKHAEDHQMLKATEYDFHAETKGPNGYEAASMVRRLIEASAEGFAYYLSEEIDDPPEADDGYSGPTRRPVVILQQEGIFRTNCLDCLDRTNLIQTIISQMAIEAFLGQRGDNAASDFWMRHSTLWADNGDALSKIYAGTGALKSSFTRSGKMSLAGAIADARKSATRLYINNFADKGRQNTMDVLLGRLLGMSPVYLYDPINDYVTSELNRRSDEYSKTSVINIWAGTFNLNGRTTGIEEDLSSWLCPELEKSQQQPEIMAVGFQEIVELSPQQIMNSDPTRKQAWEKAVKKTLNRHAKAAGSDTYVLLRSGQLVGAALCIFVRASVLRNIKNVEGSVKKTGMSGMAGNKGAVAIRMDYANTQICFVTAHLAAGFANYDERNKDYQTIQQGLKFQRNRGIDDHDAVIFLGDFNYRIGLGSDRVRHAIKMGDLDTLYSNDQLNLQMVAGLTFPFYSESRITFMPTYKYDLGTDIYDSSEKQRIPAWTDRILRKGAPLRQINYNAAPLRFSDHRPVYATFHCTVSLVDDEIKEKLARAIYNKRRAEVGTTTANTKTDDTDDEDLIGYEPIEPGLPPASSDRRKWWLDNGAPARSTVGPPLHSAPNGARPSNPFSVTDEPDWVTVPRPNAAPSSRDMSYQSLGSTSAATGKANPYSSSSTAATMNNGSAGTNGSRNLPPPFDPSTTMSSLPSNFSRIAVKDATSSSNATNNGNNSLPKRASSVMSTSSQASSSKRSAPPPIARKPVHLLSPSLTGSSVQQQQQQQQQLSRHTSLSRPDDSRLTAAAGALPPAPPPPPQPRRSRPAATTAAAEKAPSDEAAGPKLPPRPPAAADLLSGDADGDSDGMGGWETLMPETTGLGGSGRA